jgi:methyl-accepting chemotaxis protein
MTWTISRRIMLGFGICLLLVAVAALGGGWALGRTKLAYDQALRGARTALVPALHAESEMRAANVENLRYLLEADEQYQTAREERLTAARKLITQLVDSAPNDEERARWSEIGMSLDKWAQASRDAAAARRAGNLPLALSIRRDRVIPVRQQLDALIGDRVRRTQTYTDSIASAGEATAHSARQALSAGLIIALVLGALGAYLLGRSINGPLQETTNILASSAAQILAATTEQAAGTHQSMAAVSETVATVDEVAQTATQAAQRAKTVAESTQRAAERGRQGKKAVDDTTIAMRAVEGQVGSIAAAIVALAEQAQAIGEIITAVSDIAEQTKLLALNAAVESARAGEHGRGFAVVASEIKSLAGQAKQSTVQVRQILGEIQRATSAAVMTTEQGTKQVAAATAHVTQAGEIIAGLADTANDAAQSVAQIVASAGQQAIGMDQIRQAIANIHDTTQQNLAATRQTESAAQDLDKLGSRLLALVGANGNGRRGAHNN